ncbi:MAG: UDP-N-acetylmuramoyl-L-alanine--D-glutamate ligase, partial [candidate division Zixibacteria bacterium]|nr:UDP-N-acetylmuramoyl-L-alanine--D-glutamate ligase [candidate division Zixibacteria bacterium]
DLEIVKNSEERGIPIFSEIEFASWVFEGRICAVTGSNGKTTTTTLIGEMLKAAGIKSVLCGNIGKPFSEIADSADKDTIAVVEISSFQLERIEEFHPEIALILNMTPDHLDRYENFEEYKQMKQRLTENQIAADSLILNQDDEETRAANIKTKADIQFFTTTADSEARCFVKENKIIVSKDNSPEEVISVSDILIPGPHNVQNALAAVAAASCFGVEPETMAAVLKTFRGVEHRLEPVGRVAGISFVNDSKATNVDSVCWALKSFEQPLYLIAGGRDKGGKFASIADFARGKIKGIIAIGEARELIFDALGHDFQVQPADSLESAVKLAFELAIPGEVVLLSPGCASFDMFEDYEHRGWAFKKAVASLKNGKEKDETVLS